MNWQKRLFGEKLTVVTHNGDFHADEVFGVAVLSIWAERNNIELEIVRSRDEKVIGRANIVVDVGNIYDPEKNRFDHHQRGGAGAHENGVPYASFGLIWKRYGEKICGKSTAKEIEDKLVIPIDARDNGMNLSKYLMESVKEYTISRELVYALRNAPDKRGFEHMFELAKLTVTSEINLAEKKQREEKEVVKQITEQGEPEILILNQDIFWDRETAKYKKIKLVIYPEPDIDQWCIETPRDDYNDYNTNRLLFPESWRGLREEKLVEVSTIKDAVFCHRGGFFAVAKTKEAALQVAEKALSLALNSPLLK